MDPIYRPGALAEPEGLADDIIGLRRWSYDDLACIEEASRDLVIPAATTVPVPYTEAEGRAFVERQWARLADGEGLSLAITDAASDDAVGLVCLLHRQQDGVVGLGYWVVASQRRRGRASASVASLSRWALSQSTVERIEALVAPENQGSARVLTSVGFQPEGTLRAYLDFGGDRTDALLYSLIPTDLS